MQAARHVTQTAAGSALLATGVANALVAWKTKRADTVVPNVLSTVIATVAYLHYKQMPTGGGSTTLLRHSDWLITCPILIFEIAFLMGFKKQDIPLVTGAAIFAAVMVLMGLSARRSSAQWPFWLSGCAALVAVYALMYTQYRRASVPDKDGGKDGGKDDGKDGGKDDGKDDESRRAALFFLAVWIPYGIVYWASDDLRNVCYNVLDVISKVGLGVYVAYRGLR